MRKQGLEFNQVCEVTAFTIEQLQNIAITILYGARHSELLDLRITRTVYEPIHAHASSQKITQLCILDFFDLKFLFRQFKRRIVIVSHEFHATPVADLGFEKGCFCAPEKNWATPTSVCSAISKQRSQEHATTL